MGDMAKHIKSIVLPETLEAYSINSIFADVSNEKDIKEGVLAFRTFLHRLYDVLIAESDSLDNPKKIADAKEHRSAIYYNFPFLDNVKALLLNIGVHGVLADDAQSLMAGSNIFNAKKSVAQSMECLRFLTDCGIRIDGIDPAQKRLKLSEIETIIITYPDNPAMLTGLKVMAMAEIKLGTKLNQNVLMRCDCRVLKNEETDVLSILEEIIKPLSANVRDFVLRLHQLHLDKGLTCAVEIRGFWIKIKYSYKKKEIWGINASLNNGFEITVKADNTQKYADTIAKFPFALQELIAKGYGCGRKRSVGGTCDAGCEGLRIPLNDSVLHISDGIETWFDQEVSCLRK